MEVKIQAGPKIEAHATSTFTREQVESRINMLEHFEPLTEKGRQELEFLRGVLAKMKPLVLFLALMFAAPSLALADDPVGGGLCPIHLHGLTMVEFGKQAECLSKIIDRQLRQQGWAKVYYTQACRS